MNKLCAVVYTVFVWLWVYCFQADILTVTQNLLSDGQTSYERTIGALLITAILVGQRFIFKSFWPSTIELAMLTSARPYTNSGTIFPSYWLWLVPIAAVVFIGWKWAVRQMLPGKPRGKAAVLSKSLAFIVVQMLFVALTSNTSATDHYKARAEVALCKGDTATALLTGRKSFETDATLTSLRILALSYSHQLGEKLFTYALPSGEQYQNCRPSAFVLPLGDSPSKPVLLPKRSFWLHLGAAPREGMDLQAYLSALERWYDAHPDSSVSHNPYVDYKLVASLLDRNLEQFAKDIEPLLAASSVSAEAAGDSIPALPRHYREALTLYRHKYPDVVVDHHDAIMEENYVDFQQMLRSGNKTKLFERYFGTYWYYYNSPKH